MSKNIEISGNSTGKNGLEKLTLFPGEYHASRHLLQEKEKEKKMIAGSGRKLLELSGRLGRPSYFLKTLLESSAWTMAGHLKGYCLHWKMKSITISSGIQEKKKSSRLLFQLAVSVPGTGEIEYGLLPTTNAQKCKMLSTPTATEWKTDVNDKGEYATRCLKSGFQNHLAFQVKMFPTPQARDYRGMSIKRDRLPDRVAGQLNPTWVEWLMGFPIGWLDLECNNPKRFDISIEPNIPRIAKGIKNRVDRLKSLGNAIVPQVAFEIFKVIKKTKKQKSWKR